MSSPITTTTTFTKIANSKYDCFVIVVFFVIVVVSTGAERPRASFFCR